MAFLRLGRIKEASGRNKAYWLKEAIRYIFNYRKTDGRRYIGGYNMHLERENCDKMAYDQMVKTKKLFGKEGGRQGYHYKLSFAEGDNVTPEIAMKITYELCSRCFSEYECAYSVHTNTEHLHSHIVFNSIDIIEGRKYRYEKGDWVKKLQPEANLICEKYGLQGLSLEVKEDMEFKTAKNHNYSEWLKNNKRPANETVYTNNMIRGDIDRYIAYANTYDEFIGLMEKNGYIVDDRYKHITVLAPGRSKRTRLYSLTPDKQTYTRDNIKKMIMGKYVALDAEKVKEQMLGDWQKYLMTKNMLKIRIVNVDLVKKIEMDRLAVSKNLTKDNIEIYKAYLNETDKRLNIMRKYINKTIEARRGAIEALDEIIKLISYYRRYKKGEYKFAAEYRRVMELYGKIENSGYSMDTLYKYRIQAEKMLAAINDYKRHIYVEKRITERLEAFLNRKNSCVKEADKKKSEVQNQQNPQRL